MEYRRTLSITGDQGMAVRASMEQVYLFGAWLVGANNPFYPNKWFDHLVGEGVGAFALALYAIGLSAEDALMEFALTGESFEPSKVDEIDESNKFAIFDNDGLQAGFKKIFKDQKLPSHKTGPTIKLFSFTEEKLSRIYSNSKDREITIVKILRDVVKSNSRHLAASHGVAANDARGFLLTIGGSSDISKFPVSMWRKLFDWQSAWEYVTRKGTEIGDTDIADDWPCHAQKTVLPEFHLHLGYEHKYQARGTDMLDRLEVAQGAERYMWEHEQEVKQACDVLRASFDHIMSSL